MDGSSGERLDVPDGPGASAAIGVAALRAWVEEATGGTVSRWQPISGGNRCRSWAVGLEGAADGLREVYLRYQPPREPSAEPYTVWREARVYNALRGSGVPAPALIAVHPEHQAILTELAPGRADYRRAPGEAARQAIAEEFAEAIARLHALRVGEDLPGFRPAMSMADAVRAELETWGAMHEEVGRDDPLVILALNWLHENLPDPEEAPAFVHGDAGPGNFLFEDGHLTALLDWELAHPGDPMEDLAWFSMRVVMEPVPDFAACLRAYERVRERPIDPARLLYHRVFVSTRVVIIRHRNVTGEPGNSIVSKALNRRLLVDALAQAEGVMLSPPPALEAGETDRTPLYDGVIEDLRLRVAEASDDRGIVATAKNAAKVLKYLREVDRLGPAAREGEARALERLLGRRPAGPEDGRAALVAALRARGIGFEPALRHFAEVAAHESQLAARSSGGLARRRLPEIPIRRLA